MRSTGILGIEALQDVVQRNTREDVVAIILSERRVMSDRRLNTAFDDSPGNSEAC
jgi:hypothetical protein